MFSLQTMKIKLVYCQLCPAQAKTWSRKPNQLTFPFRSLIIIWSTWGSLSADLLMFSPSDWLTQKTWVTVGMKMSLQCLTVWRWRANARWFYLRTSKFLNQQMKGNRSAQNEQVQSFKLPDISMFDSSILHWSEHHHLQMWVQSCSGVPHVQLCVHGGRPLDDLTSTLQ